MKKDNKFINNLLKQMTLEEKIGQLYQTFYYGGLTTGPEFENEDVILTSGVGKSDKNHSFGGDPDLSI